MNEIIKKIRISCEYFRTSFEIVKHYMHHAHTNPINQPKFIANWIRSSEAEAHTWNGFRGDFRIIYTLFSIQCSTHNNGLSWVRSLDSGSLSMASFSCRASDCDLTTWINGIFSHNSCQMLVFSHSMRLCVSDRGGGGEGMLCLVSQNTTNTKYRMMTIEISNLEKRVVLAGRMSVRICCWYVYIMC